MKINPRHYWRYQGLNQDVLHAHEPHVLPQSYRPGAYSWGGGSSVGTPGLSSPQRAKVIRCPYPTREHSCGAMCETCRCTCASWKVPGGSSVCLSSSFPLLLSFLLLILSIQFPPSVFAASQARLLYSLGNWVMKPESSISALCFQRSKCDCQVYKRLFMFSGMKWGARVLSRERERLPCPD